MRIALFFSDSHPPPPPSIHSSFFDTKDISLPNDVTPPIPDNTADDSLPPPMPTLEELNALKSRQLPATDYDNLDSELSYPYSPSINVTGITFSTPIKLGGYFPEFFEDTDPLSPIKEQPPSDYQTMGEYVKNCETCQRINDAKFQKNSAPLHPIPVKSKVWNQVSLHVIIMYYT